MEEISMSTIECPNTECSHPIKESDLVDLEDGEAFVCPNCDEIEFTKNGDELEYSWVNGEPMAEAEPEDEVTPELPEPAPKKKKKRKVVKHKKRSHDYIDFFLDRPEGVTVDMIAEAFGLNTQAAHYAQRRTFKDAENAGYEIEKKRTPNEMKKLFFIRDKV
jgi:hypothetical protein